MTPSQPKKGIVKCAEWLFSYAKPLKGQMLDLLNEAQLKSMSDTPTNLNPKKDKQQEIIEGCRVSFTMFDGEDCFPYTTQGIVTLDLQERFYIKEVHIKLDNGQMVYNYPKWKCKLIN